MNKNIEKVAAKIVWNAIMVLTIIAVVLLMASFVAMVEAMATTRAQLIIAVASLLWLTMFALFIRWGNN